VVADVTGFLASVASADEALIACEQGADFVDAKNPSIGALTALPPETIRRIVAAVAGRSPVSAVAGDLPMEPDVIVAAARALSQTGVDYIKVGLFPSSERGACIRALAPLAKSIKIIGVMFADLGAETALAPAMRLAGFAGAMIDTAEKHGKRLLDLYDLTDLMRFIEAFHGQGLLAGLAGSLEPPDVPRLLPLSADFLGFRRALCGDEGRNGQISAQATGLVRALIPRAKVDSLEGGSMARADYRVLAAQCFSRDTRKGANATDRIFVRDFVLPACVGTYARERETPQRIRFNVDIDVKRLDHVAEDMRDVLSYDVVTDGIAVIVAAEHIALLETLAERVAALVLAHPRVSRVLVRVEKLDIRPGSVGVEIVREGPADESETLRRFPSVAAAGSRLRS
jgi:dihydroneopterin aldolase